jgi:hypothetical protein
MRLAIHWLAAPLLALVLPGLSPIASVPDGPAQLASPGPVAGEVPTWCLLERNHGACVTCCREAIDCDGGDTIPCQACAKFCKNNVPPAPGSEEPAP